MKGKNIVSRKYDYIDSIRCFSILGVVLVHCSQWVAPRSSILSQIASQGARGVQLFFIASALTLFLSMASRKEQKEERLILNFFVRRFFRIAPAFYLAIIAYTAYDRFSPRYWAPNGIEWWYVPLTVFFLNGWHPETITSVVPGGWSIAIEMTFYLFVPYFFLKLDDIRKTLFAIFFSIIFSRVASFFVVHFLSPHYSDDQKYIVNNFSFLWFFSQLPIFLLGILLYHLTIKYPSEDKRSSLVLLFFSLFLFLAFLNVQTFYGLLQQHFLYGISFVIFCLSLYYSPWGLLVNSFTVLVGRLSFSIYLTHFMILNMMRNIFANGFVLNGDFGFALAFLLVLSLSICISYITYNFIESPGINLGKYIIKKISNKSLERTIL
jgi:peptidoglycan/LPS O-acetylase OafA/YrhL